MEKNKGIVSKCSNCGSKLVFNAHRGCLVCEHCDSNYYLPKKNDKAILVRQYSAGFHPNQLNQNLTAYRCLTCKSVYYMASDEKSKKCPNCGNSASEIIQDSGYCADGIIPFKITKEQASEAFQDYVKKLSNIPSEIKAMAKTQKLMGVFVPVWNFSYGVSAFYSANAVDLLKNSDGSFYSVPKPIYGEEFKRVASLDQSATSIENDDFLELFDENDYQEIVPYIPEYTYGYRVDAINKNIHDYYQDISKTAEKKFEKEIRHKILEKYRDVSGLECSAKVQDVFFNFTYVPVYVNTFSYKGKIYKTYISGTTGKAVGKHPVSALKILGKLLKVLGLGAVIALIYFILKKG